MKKLIYLFIAVFSLSLCACGNANKKNEQSQKETKAQLATEAKYLEDVLADAATKVNKEVVIKGVVTHTCSHSGKRCFVVGKDQKTSIRIEAKGEIGGFNRELIGSEIAVKGILRESRLSKAYIDQMEEAVNQKKVKEDGSAETCAAELNNISSMRKWMEENKKDFYSLYYIDGLNYEVNE